MNCKNCNITLKNSQNFCDECGAKVIRNRLTPKVLANQINEQFISIDNKFLKTFYTLFKKPENIIDTYINGTRKRFVGVVTYYAIALTVLGFQMFLLKNFFIEFLESKNNFFTKSLPKESHNNAPFSQYPNILNDLQGVMFSILMPLIAVGMWIIYLDKKKYNYTEHIVVNLYTTAQTIYVSFIFYLLMAVFNISDFLMAALILSPLTIIYGAYVYKRLYKISFINAFLRYIAAYVIYVIVFIIIFAIISAVVFAYLFANGKINL